jgi:hypothetical protein
MRITVMRIAVVTGWLALALFAGASLSALGAGTLAWPWLAGSAGFMALFFSPLLLALCPAEPATCRHGVTSPCGICGDFT